MEPTVRRRFSLRGLIEVIVMALVVAIITAGAVTFYVLSFPEHADQLAWVKIAWLIWIVLSWILKKNNIESKLITTFHSLVAFALLITWQSWLPLVLRLIGSD